MSNGLLVALVASVGLGGSLLLYVLVRAAADRRRVLDSEDAWRAARRDTHEVSDRR